MHPPPPLSLSLSLSLSLPPSLPPPLSLSLSLHPSFVSVDMLTCGYTQLFLWNNLMTESDEKLFLKQLDERYLFSFHYGEEHKLWKWKWCNNCWHVHDDIKWYLFSSQVYRHIFARGLTPFARIILTQILKFSVRSDFFLHLLQLKLQKLNIRQLLRLFRHIAIRICKVGRPAATTPNDIACNALPEFEPGITRIFETLKICRIKPLSPSTTPRTNMTWLSFGETKIDAKSISHKVMIRDLSALIFFIYLFLHGSSTMVVVFKKKAITIIIRFQ